MWFFGGFGDWIDGRGWLLIEGGMGVFVMGFFFRIGRLVCFFFGRVGWLEVMAVFGVELEE